MKKLQLFIDKQSEWSDKTFGDGKGKLTVPKLSHLKKEIDELVEILEKYYIAKNSKGVTTADKGLMYLGGISEEFADCFILLFDAARCYGMNAEMILAAMELKLEINKTRKWKKVDKNRVIEHIKD